jgi:hypothetical protein
MAFGNRASRVTGFAAQALKSSLTAIQDSDQSKRPARRENEPACRAAVATQKKMIEVDAM